MQWLVLALVVYLMVLNNYAVTGACIGMYLGIVCSQVLYVLNGIRQKEHNTNFKLLRRVLIRNVSHFYGLPLDFCGKKHHDFCQRTTFSREKRRNPWKSTALSGIA